MLNSVTDYLKLVEQEVVRGWPILGRIPLPFFDQDILVIEGISQEVFRGKNHHGSVKAGSALVKARRGDIIYYVTLTPQWYTFTGTIQTQDKYHITYKMQTELVVTNPKRVVEQYRQSKDPSGWMIDRLKKIFEGWAAGIGHDKLDDSAKPSFDATLQLLGVDCGVSIRRYSWNFIPAPTSLKELEIYQNTKLRKIEMRSAHEIKMIEIENEHEVKDLDAKLRRERERDQKAFDREEKLKENKVSREEKRRKEQNEAYIKLLSETVKNLVEINRWLIHDALDYDRSVKAVLQNYLKLLEVFDSSLPEEGKVIDTTSSNGAIPFTEEDVNGTDSSVGSLFSSNNIEDVDTD